MNVFSQNSKREHKTFPKPKDVLHGSVPQILEWMEKNINNLLASKIISTLYILFELF